MVKAAIEPQHLERIKDSLFHLDRILRGEATSPSELRNAEIRIPVLGITGTIVCLAVVYGFCMAIFAMIHGYESSELLRAFQQTFATMIKVPLLFLLTLGITFPSLYMFNALVGSQLRVFQVLKLLIASLAVNLSVLASMGPILAFFSVSTPNYAFIVLLNVVVFAVAGLLGLSFLVQTLNRLTATSRGQTLKPAKAPIPGRFPSQRVAGEDAEPAVIAEVDSETQPAAEGPLDAVEGLVLGKHEKTVFTCWIIVFGFVGAQMGWVLRPFIGSPNMEFSWFRQRESNFFAAVLNTFFNLFS